MVFYFEKHLDRFCFKGIYAKRSQALLRLHYILNDNR